ncbi:MAG: arginine--tRNA ligase [Bacteroidetes bacterium]|nr:arginine--tRNA ligase [Bacteroidota bacterium]MDA0888242.1 arginine--tRNA ligase [Bacteroidota bacterium]MDA1084364.1 arginine--tRNA ligase [Bacteroidota bacterium]
MEALLTKHLSGYFKAQHNKEVLVFEIQPTKPQFEGDLTLVVFPLLKIVPKKPADLAAELGDFLVDAVSEVQAYNVVQGFLNIEISDAYYINFLLELSQNPNFGFTPISATSDTLLVEYSSPNTNKPLHLGHIRNNLLGASVSNILAAHGDNVHTTQIINDRGIHICKSMVAWQKFGNAETPETAGLKGDALVGKYYVLFDQQYKKEIADLVASGVIEDQAKIDAPILQEAKDMLLKWEQNDPDVRSLWEQMNAWVYDGFAKTYSRLGVHFESYYYESDTYLLGKETVDEGLSKGVFYTKDDGSVWVDLREDGLDEKLLLRSDGTSVYMTQDLGTARLRYTNHPDMKGMVYTVGNEQDYHFKVLFLILKKLGYDWASQLHHLSYGMVDLPSGKMKSREGTVVDADALMDEMHATAKQISQELGKLDGMTDDEKETLYHTIGMGALKYYILKVDPKKRILFDPKASVDFSGNTGPFIQYTHARIQSILRKAGENNTVYDTTTVSLHNKEKAVLKMLGQFPATVAAAAKQYSPALIANYVYDLVKHYNSYYQEVPILVEDSNTKSLRVALCAAVGQVIQKSLGLLGIDAPERM